MLSSELHFFQVFYFSLFLASYCSSMCLHLCSCTKEGRVTEIGTASLTHQTASPMVSTGALENLDFSGSGYAIPEQGSDWSHLGHMHMPRPVRMTRETEDCDWPGLDYCISLKGGVGKCMIDSPTRTTWGEVNSPKVGQSHLPEWGRRIGQK